jgi:hypothetical protein
MAQLRSTAIAATELGLVMAAADEVSRRQKVPMLPMSQ